MGLAARVWQHAGLADATADALRKLKAAGIEADGSALDIAQPEIVATEPAFEDVWAATVERHAITFDYRTSAGGTDERRVQPWGMSRARGRWYVVGFDLDRERAAGLPAEPDPGDGAARPAQRLLRRSRRLRPAAGHGLGGAPGGVAHGGPAGAPRPRRGPAPPCRGLPTRRSWERAELDYAQEDQLVDELVSYGDVVVVEQPDTLREAVVARLTELAG